MFKLVVLAVLVAVANAGVLYTTLQQPAVVTTYTAGVKTEAVNANVPASTTLVKHTPVVHSVVHSPVVTYNAAAVRTVPVVSAPVGTVYNAGVVAPSVYSVPVVTGHKVVTHVSPVEQHGYQVVY